ncbi:zinc-dependent alcohol dehydrogenase [Paractinoplanes toevensis]|uniref:Sorbitol dehydrogenase n=1 Tax=Paractinoplanes toevensis TaxID=571911 RepID=A0A919T7W8_9ACTN|nr:alcohol dehydrogenase catalytic domain-containing protein [Actinoplanes toevensis]GIM90645.1 sorbitol dehydrogenase [Actinoplanes toevensis]
MRVARLFGAGDVRVLDEEAPVPAAGEELVEVTSVGVCGSDLHWFTEGAIGDAVLARPLVLGHEMAGVIRGGPRDGTRVAIDPAVPCGACEPCLDGDPNLCLNIVFAGHGPTDGGLRQVLAWPGRRLHPIPDSLSDDEGALLEPLGVALHAYDLAHARIGRTVAVIGCGPIGLMLIQLARLGGATRVIAADPLSHRAEAAARLGAEITDGEADLVFEVSGSDAAVDTALRTAKPGARVILVGIPDGDRTTFTASHARRKGLTMVMSRRMGEVYPRAIDLAARRRVDLPPLVSAAFPLDEVAAALSTAAARDGLKVVVHPQA